MALDVTTFRSVIQARLDDSAGLEEKDYLLLSQIIEILDERIAASDVIQAADEKIAIIESTGDQYITDITTDGTTYTTQINQLGTTKLNDITTTGDGYVTTINTDGTTAISNINTAGTDNVAAVQAEGTTQVGLVNTAGTTQVGLVNAAGSTQVGLVQTEGATQVSAVNTAGTNKVGDVTSEGDTQVTRVQNTGDAEVLAVQAEGTTQRNSLSTSIDFNTTTSFTGGTLTILADENNDGHFNAVTYTAKSTWPTAQTIELTGDATGSTTFDGTAGITLPVTIADNSHNHSVYISSSDTGEQSIAGNLTIIGNLTVSGTTTTINTSNESVSIADNIILLNSDVQGTPSQDSGMEIERGTAVNALFFWDESEDRWTAGIGTGLSNLAASTFVGALSGNASTATKLANARTISITGDVTGSASFDGSSNISISTSSAHTHNYLASGGTAVAANKWATARTITLSGDASGSVSIDGTANVGITVTVANDSHTHDGRYYTETESDDLFAARLHTHSYADSDHSHDYAPSDHSHSYAASVHSHDYAASVHSHDYAASNHNHNANYYTETESDDRFAAKIHSHSYASNDHTHSYAASIHSHPHDHDEEYAASGHSHNYAASNHSHNYAASGHSHNYAASDHNHNANYYTETESDDRFAPKVHSHSYASTNHTHSYAATSHTHSYASTTHSHDSVTNSTNATNASNVYITANYSVNNDYVIPFGNIGVDSYNHLNADTVLYYNPAYNRLYSQIFYANNSIYSAGNITAYSDRRAKENIKPLEQALELINKLDGVRFNFKGKEEKRVGVIAQDVQKVLPEVVVYHEDEDKYGVDYGNICAVLIEAVKELSKQVNELRGI